jgi:transcriptional/translational regulatory protein YebC/TACO1
MMLAIDAGALDVEIEDEGYTIITSPEDFGRVLEAVQKNGLEPMAAEVAMIPNTTITLTDPDDIKYMNRLIDMLEDNDDIQNVYNNWDMPEE